MWKLLLVTAIIVSVGEAQRSTYAGRPGSHSKLLPKYRRNETDSGLGTRGGEENSESTSTTTTTTTTTTALPPHLQGTLEDERFVHRVALWPDDRQPFWFKNRNAISEMRGREVDGGRFVRRPRPHFARPLVGPGTWARYRYRLAEDDEPSNFANDPLPFYQGRNYR